MVNKVRMKATEEDFENADKDQGEFVLPKPGYYVLTVKEIIPGFSKDDDGNEDKKRPRLECIYEITGVGVEDVEPTENYGNVWDYVSFSSKSGFRRAQFLKGMGLSDGSSAFDDEVDVDELVGTKVVCRLAHERGQTKDDPKKAKIRSIIPYEDRDSSAAFGGDDGDDASGGDDDGDAEDYTEEELMALEPKELGTIAKDEFSLTPSEYVVKATRGANKGKADVAKSKAKLVAAILEAQEAESSEDESSEDEGEDPF